MADSPYLVAIALVEIGGKRAMPLAGRSQKPKVSKDEIPNELAYTLVLELLIRVLQRSELSALKRAAGMRTILVVELPLEVFPEIFPKIKSYWLSSGDTDRFITALQKISFRAWSVDVPEKYKGTQMIPLS